VVLFRRLCLLFSSVLALVLGLGATVYGASSSPSVTGYLQGSITLSSGQVNGTSYSLGTTVPSNTIVWAVLSSPVPASSSGGIVFQISSSAGSSYTPHFYPGWGIGLYGTAGSVSGSSIFVPFNEVTAQDTIYAVGISVNSSFSVVGASYSSGSPPSAPTGLTVQGAAQTGGEYQVNGSGTLVWQPVNGATSYEVLEDGKVVSTVTSASYSFSVTVGATHQFAVVALNGIGSSPPSSSIIVVGVGPPQTAPTVTVSNVTSDSALVGWSSVTGATSYQVYLDTTKVAQTSGNSYQLSGLTQGVQYSVSVFPVNQYGQGNPGSASFTTSTLAAPSGLVLGVGDKQLTLSWQPVSGATGYAIYLDGSQVATATAPFATLTGLTDGVQYTVQVAAYDGAGNQSPLSQPETGTPHPPPVPINGLAAIGGGDELKLVWSGTEAPFSGEVLQDGKVVATFTTSDDTYTVSGLTRSTDYTVKITDQGGNTASGDYNTGSVVALIPPQPPDPVNVIQSLVDRFAPAGKWVLVIIGAAVGVGVAILLARWLWWRTLEWLWREDLVLEKWHPDLDGYGYVDRKGRLHIRDIQGYMRWRDLNE
jgi:hypothetical protein